MKTGTARAAAAIAGLGAALLGLGAAAFPWWSAAGVEVHLTRMSLCGPGGECAHRGLDGFGGASAWPDLALAAAAASIAAALVLFVAGIGLVLGRRLRTVCWGAGVLSLFAAALGIVVIALRPELEGLSPAYGMAMTLSGAGIGVAVSIAVGRAQTGSH